ncbi:MAG: DUF1214 domain-containing protein [Pseudomonadota bacterium]
MQTLVRIIVAIIFGANLGALAALWFGGMISGGPQIGSVVDLDGWQSDWSIGSESANPYVRARVARNGLMALRKEEAVYFIKNQDDSGQSLIETCTYQVSGGAYPARWWSITLYDGDNRLPMNEDGRLSYDLTQSKADGDGTSADWSFQVSARAPAEVDTPWVSSRAADTFDLMLRLYQPDARLFDDPDAALTPPSIERVSCDGATS